MSKVFQAIPLTATLRVDVYLVVKCFEVDCSVQVNDFLIELLATKSRELNILQTPVELNVFSALDLLA